MDVFFLVKIRMTTFIKTKLKKPDDQTNINNYRAANIAEYHIISKLIFLRIIYEKYIIL